MTELSICHAINCRADQLSYTGLSFRNLTELMLDVIHKNFNVISLNYLSEEDYEPACQYIKTWHPSPDYIIEHERNHTNDRKYLSRCS